VDPAHYVNGTKDSTPHSPCPGMGAGELCVSKAKVGVARVSMALVAPRLRCSLEDKESFFMFIFLCCRFQTLSFDNVPINVLSNLPSV